MLKLRISSRKSIWKIISQIFYETSVLAAGLSPLRCFKPQKVEFLKERELQNPSHNCLVKFRKERDGATDLLRNQLLSSLKALKVKVVKVLEYWIIELQESQLTSVSNWEILYAQREVNLQAKLPPSRWGPQVSSEKFIP